MFTYLAHPMLYSYSMLFYVAYAVTHLWSSGQPHPAWKRQGIVGCHHTWTISLAMSLNTGVAVHPLGPGFCLNWEYHAVAIRRGGLSLRCFGHYAYFISYILDMYHYTN